MAFSLAVMTMTQYVKQLEVVANSLTLFHARSEHKSPELFVAMWAQIKVPLLCNQSYYGKEPESYNRTLRGHVYDQ